MNQRLISPTSEIIIIRPATKDDISTMIALSYNKRREYEKHHPQFWRYVEGAEGSQAKWFQKLLVEDDSILLVAESNDTMKGFIIGRIVEAPKVYDPGGLTLIVDDFCVEAPEHWPSVGGKFLFNIKELAKARGVVQFVIVAGHHDEPKRQFLQSYGLTIASEWYVGWTGSDSHDIFSKEF